VDHGRSPSSLAAADFIPQLWAPHQFSGRYEMVVGVSPVDAVHSAADTTKTKDGIIPMPGQYRSEVLDLDNRQLVGRLLPAFLE
jgi:hypothetical protein